MQKLKMIVYVILLVGLIIGYIQGFDSREQDARMCANYFDKQNTFEGIYYTEQLYWIENGFCCRYVLINNSIEEECEND